MVPFILTQITMGYLFSLNGRSRSTDNSFINQNMQLTFLLFSLKYNDGVLTKYQY